MQSAGRSGRDGGLRPWVPCLRHLLRYIDTFTLRLRQMKLVQTPAPSVGKQTHMLTDTYRQTQEAENWMNTKFSVEQSVNVRCPVIEDIQNVKVCNVELV